jgi:hypothetical protein
MVNTETIQSAIRLQLTQQGSCTLEALLQRLSDFSWSEIFTVVDQLSREGQLVLRHPARCNYEISIGTAGTIPEPAHTGGAGPASQEDPDR